MAKKLNPGFVKIGLRLRAVRTAMGLTGTEFAKRAKLKQNALSNWEIGERQPSIKNAIALCVTYDLTLDWIYRGVRYGLRRRVRSLLSDFVEH